MGLLGFRVPGLNTLFQLWLATLQSTFEQGRQYQQAEWHHQQQYQHQ
jgi:hypothetical protein